MTYARTIALVLGLALVLTGVYFIYQRQTLPKIKGDSNTPFNELTVYISVLENESKKEGKPLSCFPEIAETFHFKDQWGGALSCSMTDTHLYIKSAGPDGVLDTADDLVLRRRLLPGAK